MTKKQAKSSSTTVRSGEGKPAKQKVPILALGRILVPLDFSGKARQALDYAVPLATRYGGKISLLHVVEPLPPYPAYPGEAGVAPLNPPQIVAATRERLSRLARELVPPALLGKTLVRIGRAYVEIVDAAEEIAADLIALSTHGHTGLSHVLLGSTAERVVRHAPCPVLTVRRH